MNQDDCTDRIRITTMPGIEVWCYRSAEYPGHWVVKSTITAPDADTGQVGSWEMRQLVNFDGYPTRDQLGRWVKYTVLAQLIHELDEGLSIDGVQINNPHKDSFRTIGDSVIQG